EKTRLIEATAKVKESDVYLLLTRSITPPPPSSSSSSSGTVLGQKILQELQQQ
ncbi:hypothetical protein BGZ65_012601, partial [Modicella reniformis]